VLLQKVDCKHQIDVIDMVGPKPLLPLCAASDSAHGPRRKAAKNLAFGVGEIIHRRNSNIAHASEKRGERVKSCELLDFIYILYRETGEMYTPILSRECKVVIVGHKARQSRLRKMR